MSGSCIATMLCQTLKMHPLVFWNSGDMHWKLSNPPKPDFSLQSSQTFFLARKTYLSPICCISMFFFHCHCSRPKCWHQQQESWANKTKLRIIRLDDSDTFSHVIYLPYLGLGPTLLFILKPPSEINGNVGWTRRAGSEL